MGWPGGTRGRVIATLVGGLALAAMAACARPRAVPGPGPGAVPARAAATAGSAGAVALAHDDSAPPIDPARLHAVLVNGGGNRSANYQSHYLHVRAMLDVLATAGVPHDQITVFSSDGDDPGEDQAVRELRPEGEGWLLEGTPLEGSLGRPMEYVSTTIPGQTLHPATPEALQAWFAEHGKKIPPGDTLLFYVTDHGSPNRDDPTDTRITMWGEKKTFSVRELHAALSSLDPGVRVVMLMSQCFSGGFAHMTSHGAATGTELPSGNACGYFASTHDRPAYGCYPENRGANNVGHSVRFIESLAANGSFPRAQAHTLVHDRTPDVPLRTSDVQLEQLLERVAHAQGDQLAPYADALLREAWHDPARIEPQIRLLDRMGQSFGFASPRSLAEVGVRLERLPAVADTVHTHADAWGESFDDATRANLTRFLDSHPDMRDRVAPDKIRTASPDAARALGGQLLAQLGPYTEADTVTLHRLELLDHRAEIAEHIAYRMKVREAGLLRMRALLLRIAGERYLETRATPAERTAFDALERCEDLDLDVHANQPAPVPTDAFPSYEDDLAQAQTVLPAWMGIQFRPVTPEERDKDKLPSGAVSVRVVYPDSPAAQAGLEVGDILLGPPGKPFSEPRQVREWTMLQEVGKPRPLEVLHDGKLVRRTLVPGEHPGKFPELPGPPKVGSAAPALGLTSYRGTPPTSLAGGGTHLLFFWATWCGPCKASLPEVMAFARERDVQVVAITDEEPAQLDRFFAKFAQEFPPLVAIDAKRDAFLAYGVSGTPTFVLVDGAGVVRSIWTGYTPAKGLQVEGWHWSGRSAPKP